MPRTMEDDPPNPERLPRDANSYHICHYTVGMLALVHTHPQYLTDGDLRGDYQASVQEMRFTSLYPNLPVCAENYPNDSLALQ